MRDLSAFVQQLGLVLSRRSKRHLMLATLGSIAVTLLETGSILLIAPLMQLLMGADIDTGLLGRIREVTGATTRDGLLLFLISAVVGGFIIKDVFTLGFRWWMNGFVTQERADTYVRLLGYFVKGPYSLHLERSTASIMRVVAASTGQVFALVILGLVGAITELITVLIIGVALVWASPIFSLGLLAFLGLVALVLHRAIRGPAHRLGRRQIELSQAGYEIAFHTIGGVKEIKLRHTHDHFLGKYRRVENEAARVNRVQAFLAELPKHALEIAFFVAFLALTAAVVRRDGSDTLVMSIAVLAAGAFRVMPALSRLIVNLANIKSGRPALEDIAQHLDYLRELPTTQPPAEIPLPFDRSINVQELGFKYGPDLPWVLRDITISIPAGSSIAFVGASGAGKSTLVDALLGLHEPTEGEVLVDGVDIGADPAAWHANISVVPQEVYLLDASIRENVAFDQDADAIDDDLVRESLRQAQLIDAIEALPEGVDTKIGERGTRLSGGQRQRLGIARALYRRPKLLVLDEATSALDNETERKITETIAALHGSVTVLVVAHRLSTVRDVDRVVFMSNGRVAASGPFDEVRRVSPEFANLVRLGSLDRTEGV